MQEYIKKILGLGTVTLIRSNDGMEYIMKIVKSLEDSDLLMKGVSEAIENELKEQKGRFLGMLLGSLGAILLGNMLVGKWINRAGDEIIKAGDGSLKTQNF